MDYSLSSVAIYDLMMLTKKIDKRKRSDYLMQLAIAHNPHSKTPKDLFTELRGADTDPLDTYYDKEGLEKLKSVMAGGRMQVVDKADK